MSKSDTRAGFRRGELYTLGKLIESRIVRHSEKVIAYRDDCSDTEVARLATAALSREVDAAAVARIRKQMFGSLMTEGRTASELLPIILRRQDAMLDKIRALEAKLSVVERDLYDDGNTEDSVTASGARLTIAHQPHTRNGKLG